MSFIFNSDIRAALRASGLRGYEVAAELGMTEYNFSRQLCRSEIEPDKKENVYKAIKSLLEKRQKELATALS